MHINVSQTLQWLQVTEQDIHLQSRLFRRCPVEYHYPAGSCIRRDRAGKDGTKRRDQILRAQTKASDIKLNIIKELFNYLMSEAFAWTFKIPSFPALSRRIQLPLNATDSIVELLTYLLWE